jgi:formamidopyrimidine-DNA glycosylase
MAGLRAEEVECLVNTARKLLLANVTETSGDQTVSDTGMRRTTGRSNKEERLWVYGRRNQPCRTCGQLIQSRKQGLDAAHHVLVSAVPAGSKRGEGCYFAASGVMIRR